MRRIQMWDEFFGARGVDDPMAIDRADLDAFVEQRRAGTLKVLARNVRNRTIEVDLQFLSAVLNWAAGVTRRDLQDRGSEGLIPYNPIAGYDRPKGRSPRRPIGSYDRFEATLEHAAAADSQKLLPFFMQLVEPLGWRVTAICELWASDLDLRRTKAAPHGRIRKRGEVDKEGMEMWVPLSAKARSAVDGLLEFQPVIGDMYLFPAPRGPRRGKRKEDHGQPWTKDHAQKLHKRAQNLAGYGHQPEGDSRICAGCHQAVPTADQLTACPASPYIGFHAYRRKWATERKHLPRPDVAAAGAWKSVRTLDIYQLPDEETLYAVVSDQRKLRENRSSKP